METLLDLLTFIFSRHPLRSLLYLTIIALTAIAIVVVSMQFKEDSKPNRTSEFVLSPETGIV